MSKRSSCASSEFSFAQKPVKKAAPPADELVILSGETRGARGSGGVEQMSSQDPSRAGGPALTPLPRLEDLSRAGEAYDGDRVGEAFDAFRRHVTALQAQLRVLQAAPQSAITEPSGHDVRMDGLHLLRSDE